MTKDYSSLVNLSDSNSAHTKEIELIGYGKRVLDFGCATGNVAKVLKERGCYVVGIEIDPAMAEEAAKVCDRVIVCDLDTVDLVAEVGEEKFDVCLFGDVIEHLKYPSRLLAQARDVLESGGYIVVSVPNIAHASVRLMLLEGRFDYADMGILDDTHLHFFTRQSISDLLESCGYLVETVDFTEQEVPEYRVREALDPLGISNFEEVVKSFAHWEAKAFQYVLKAFPASEEDQVKRLSEEKIRAERENKLLMEKLAESESRIGELKSQIESHVAELKLAKARIAELEEALKSKSRQIESMSKELQEASDYARKLEAKIAEKDVRLRELTEEIDKNERRVRSLGSLRAQVIELEEALESKSRQIESMSKELQEASDYARKLEEETRERDNTQVIELEEALKSKSRQIESMSKELQEASDYARKLEETIREKDNQVKMLVQAIAEKEKLISSFEEKIEGSR
ncbi:MAG: methyltransferase domain-containing protein [Actinomycetota bacterium]|nr:methyltransferase domain-containing protein [Actinomycetota bacterium]